MFMDSEYLVIDCEENNVTNVMKTWRKLLVNTWREKDKVESLMEVQETTLFWLMEIKMKLFLIILLCFSLFVPSIYFMMFLVNSLIHNIWYTNLDSYPSIQSFLYFIYDIINDNSHQTWLHKLFSNVLCLWVNICSTPDNIVVVSECLFIN